MSSRVPVADITHNVPGESDLQKIFAKGKWVLEIWSISWYLYGIGVSKYGRS
jgi:hypothetical protein